MKSEKLATAAYLNAFKWRGEWPNDRESSVKICWRCAWARGVYLA